MKKLLPVQSIVSTKGETDIFQRFSQGLPVNKENKEHLFDLALNAIGKQDQYQFYPLIEELFTIIGFKCRVSRSGDTNNRVDAFILDDKYSIPVEIKSKTEIPYINNKSIRQAAENKVILLSRKFYPTEYNVTSLAVGFDYPNDRSGVYDLVDDVHTAYGFIIGMVSVKDLLAIAWDVIMEGRLFDKNRIVFLKGQFV